MPSNDKDQNVIIAEIKKDICYIKDTLSIIHKKLDNSDRRFALKWVEKVMIGMLTLVGASVVAALMSMIIQ